MRKVVLDQVYELARKNKKIFFIGSDLGYGVLKQFKDEMPERFLMEGVYEANIIGVAAGLALEGKIIYVNTIATFLTRRCFEQIVLDLCLHNVKVRLIASGGGVVYAPLGPTHQAIDDLAILRVIPNMTIVCPADAEEMKRFMPLTVDYPGPIYIRLGKGSDPLVSRPDLPFEIGKAICLREGKDALIVTTGITLKQALDAAVELEKERIQATVLHMHTIKPLDTRALQQYASLAPVVVTIEEHSIIGGLGSAVAEFLAEQNYERPKRFQRIGLPDQFMQGYGNQASMMERYGVTTAKVVQVVKWLSNPRDQ